MNVPEPDKDYLGLCEAARLLGFPSRTVARWARAGRVTTVVVDGERRFPREGLLSVGGSPPDP